MSRKSPPEIAFSIRIEEFQATHVIMSEVESCQAVKYSVSCLHSWTWLRLWRKMDVPAITSDWKTSGERVTLGIACAEGFGSSRT